MEHGIAQKKLLEVIEFIREILVFEIQLIQYKATLFGWDHYGVS